MKAAEIQGPTPKPQHIASLELTAPSDRASPPAQPSPANTPHPKRASPTAPGASTHAQWPCLHPVSDPTSTLPWPGVPKGLLTTLFLLQHHFPGWREAPVQPACELALAGLPRCDLQETPWKCLLGGQAVLPLPAAKKVSDIQFRSQYLGFTLKRRDLFINLYINRCVTEILISFKTFFVCLDFRPSSKVLVTQM